MPYTLLIHPDALAIIRLPAAAPLPVWAMDGAFWSVTRTRDECSVVCAEAQVPAGVRCERGWRMLQVAGILDFSLTGVLATLTASLAEAGVSIFALSTFDTDYLLVRDASLKTAVDALRRAGYTVDDLA